MSARVAWTPENVAVRIRRLADEHGVPNRFQLQEIAGTSERRDLLALSQLLRLQGWLVDRALAPTGWRVEYERRQGRERPAAISVDRLLPSNP